MRTLRSLKQQYGEYRRAVLFALVLVMTAIGHASANDTSSYTLAIVPNQLPVASHRAWAPLADQLSKRLNVKIEIKVYRNIPRFETELQNGVPDFAFMNPYHQVMVNKKPGYIPLVRSSDPLTGILVVRKDSPIRSVKELDGKNLAFPSANAFGSSLYMRALLSERLRIKFMPYYIDAHTEVYRHVILGEAAAGGGIQRTLDREPEEVRKRLRVLYETPATAPHALSAHPRVPKALRELMAQAVLELGSSDDPAGKTMLANVQLAAPVRADYEKDYRPLEKLGLGKYVVPSN